ncbi:MAG: S8 family serine peptidase [Candidatus Magnetobacterium sp. LHC-1]|nr:S8 family serine peptidase [Nitrospirota bacterium]
MEKDSKRYLRVSRLGLLLVVMAVTLLFVSATVDLGFAAEAPLPASKVSTPGGYDNLASKAQRTGSVRVIVKVNVAVRPIGELSKSDAASQRSVIAQAQETVLEKLSGHNVISSYKYKFIPYISMTVDKAALDAVLALPEVDKVEEDITMSHSAMSWNMGQVGATNAWSMGYDGSGYAVAVLDTGVDKEHPFLAGSVVSEACYSTTNAGYKTSSICPGGVASSTDPGSAMPYAGSCPNRSGQSGNCAHGTHVAGMVAGRNDGSLSGVANKASIIAIQVFSRLDDAESCKHYGTDSCTTSFSSDGIKGIERVIELKDTYKIAAINMSLGSGRYYSNCDKESSAYKAAIDNARSVGIASIIASGNSGYSDSIASPGCISTAISVGSTTSADQVSDFSNSASFLNLLAPGSDINSAIPDGQYESKNGTSMATPHVAGAWAVLKQAKPSATIEEILDALVKTGLSITDGRNNITKSRIQVDAAAKALTSGGPATKKVKNDFNADGKSDILLQNTTNGAVYIWLMNGTNIAGGGFVVEGMSAEWEIKGIGDFNGDGKGDILLQNVSNGDVAIWTMNGTGISSGDYVITGIPLQWQFTAFEDFDGDGKADILLQNSDSGDVVMWFMNGASITSGVYVVKGMPSNWAFRGAADLNGDAKSDMLWQDTTNGDVYAMLMNGASASDGDFVAMGIPDNWKIKAVGDFDGDGKADVIWQDNVSGDTAMWLMNGHKVAGGNYLVKGIPSAWQIKTTGDFSGDGKVDVLWQDNASGDTAMWLMNGLNIAGGDYVVKGLTSNWKIR